jgi:predicted metal-binding protein
MPKHMLCICKSCHRTTENRPENPPFDGSILLDKIDNFWLEQFPFDEIEIQPVGCLWACNHGCVVSVASPDKPTYVFCQFRPQKTSTVKSYCRATISKAVD